MPVGGHSGVSDGLIAGSNWLDYGQAEITGRDRHEFEQRRAQCREYCETRDRLVSPVPALFKPEPPAVRTFKLAETDLAEYCNVPSC